MKAPIIILIVVLLVVGYGVSVVFHITAVQDSSTNPAIVQAPMQFGSGNKSLTYVAAGDSTAVGQGASDVAHTYPYQVAEHLAQNGATVNYSNVAVGGAETEDVITAQLPKIIAADPDVVTISVGANDMTHLHTNASILANDKTIIDTLLQQTNAQIYIMDIPNFYAATLLPPWYVKILEFKIRSLNPELLALDQSRVHVIDIHNYGWSQYPNLAATVSSDQFHPNDLGYQNWANAFIASLQSNGQ